MPEELLKLGGSLDSYVAECELNGGTPDKAVLGKARESIARMAGKADATAVSKVDDFLNSEFAIPNIELLPIDAKAVPIVQSRLAEARAGLKTGAYLSVVILCGSVLEAVLLSAAQKQPEPFNRAKAAPKDTAGNTKKLHEWSLAQLIDAASELGMVGLDVKKFSHGLRDFRNFIHPNEQIRLGFNPDEHTAKLCFHVLRAALAGVAGQR